MIEVSSLTRYYGDFPALRDVSFQVQSGQIVGLLGLNGAGKSTTLKVLAGLIPPSSGTVSIDGLDVRQHPAELRSRIGFLPEEPPLYRDMTVRDFLRHAGRLKGMSSADVERRLPEIIELTQLRGREDQLIETLSHGYRKRVGIAQAVLHDPRLVILDEPISGLDPAQIVEMRKTIARLREGRAVMVSSHILSEVSQTCDRILVLHEGRLVAQGTEQELRRSLNDSRVQVTVRGDADAFHRTLEASELVQSFVPHAVEAPFTCAIVELVGDVRERLLVELIEAGFGLRLVESPQSELEAIFLGLTREEVTT